MSGRKIAFLKGAMAASALLLLASSVPANTPNPYHWYGISPNPMASRPVVVHHPEPPRMQPVRYSRLVGIVVRVRVLAETTAGTSSTTRERFVVVHPGESVTLYFGGKTSPASFGPLLITEKKH